MNCTCAPRVSNEDRAARTGRLVILPRRPSSHPPVGHVLDFYGRTYCGMYNLDDVAAHQVPATVPDDSPDCKVCSRVVETRGPGRRL